MDVVPKPGLSQPRAPSRRGLVLLSSALLVFGLVVALIYAWGKEPLAPVPAASTVHAVAMVIICSITAALLLTHAQATGERGYLLLGGTFAYVSGVMLLFPAVYPNGVVATDPPSPLWGTLQSSATLFHPWHLALIVGVSASAVILSRDQRTGRRPDLGSGMRMTGAAVAVALVVTAIAVVPLIDAFPPVVEGVQATMAALVGFRLEAALALVGTVVVAYECRDGSVIGRWLLAVMVVSLGEAVTMLNADRYSLAWYYNRIFGLVAALILLFVLVRDLGQVERRTKLLLDRDSLTGAVSRATMLATLDRELRRARHSASTVSLLWVDVDGFKAINEGVGQQVGDRILVEVHARIVEEVGASDRVGRMGGDEFAAVIPDSDRSMADDLARRIIERLREPFHVRDVVVDLTASAGLATGTEVAVDAEVLARHASIAMIAAKRAGGDRAEWFADVLGSHAIRRAQLRHALTESIRQRSFTLEYQPIVDLTTGEVAGAEALVGWMQDGQRVAAGHFIRFAEDSGLIVAIGRQVVTALEIDGPAILAALPPPFILTFNLSVKELADDGIVDSLLRGTLANLSTRMMAEVTESFEMQDDSRAAVNLARLRERGYRVAIDDFGVGFSNFVRLAALRPAVIKVDRSIIVRAGSGSPSGVATLQATMDVARAFNCRMLAEGVESNDEAEICVRMGVELAQGYRYSRSLPVDGLLAFWASRAVVGLSSVAELGELAGRDGHPGPA